MISRAISDIQRRIVVAPKPEESQKSQKEAALGKIKEPVFSNGPMIM